NSPLFYYDNSTGLEGTIETILPTKNGLFVATRQGLFYSEFGSLDPANQFIRILEVGVECWSIIRFNMKDGPRYIASATSGLYEIDDQLNVNRISNYPYRTIFRSSTDTNRIYLSWRNRVSSIRYENKWVNEGRIAQVTGYIRSITNDSLGNIWIGTNKSVTRISNPEFGELVPRYNITTYDTSDGLLDNPYYVVYWDRKIVVGTSEGILMYSGQFHKFQPMTDFDIIPGWNRRGYHRIFPYGKNLWLTTYLDGVESVGSYS
ncbi:MAG: hypothetical protein IH946_06520, partial [Bacteroidetes bacterium]|nr:hypothetical protein [Bacteroidota bacterium]